MVSHWSHLVDLWCFYFGSGRFSIYLGCDIPSEIYQAQCRCLMNKILNISENNIQKTILGQVLGHLEFWKHLPGPPHLLWLNGELRGSLKDLLPECSAFSESRIVSAVFRSPSQASLGWGTGIQTVGVTVRHISHVLEGKGSREPGLVWRPGISYSLPREGLHFIHSILSADSQALPLFQHGEHNACKPKKKMANSFCQSTYGISGAQGHLFSSPGRPKEMAPGPWPAAQGRSASRASQAMLGNLKKTFPNVSS